VGAGMSGVFTAAQLKRLGIDVILLEKASRPGNSWATRYHAAELRFPRSVLGDEFFSPPIDWPEFISPVAMANWIEGYAIIMGLEIVC
jgi:cation diffusion facilitator CzcD-associated flavoprotein CzcO